MSKHHNRIKRDAAARQRRRTAPGAPPGTLKADPDAPRPQIKVIAYSDQEFVEQEIQQPSELKAFLGRFPVTWINVDGLGDAKVLSELGEIFRIHPLALEDVINVHQRAKLEHYSSHQFLVFHQVDAGERIQSEQISLFLGSNFVLTFQEEAGDCFEPLRERMRQHVGLLRKSGPDYLAYSLLDSIVDHYFPLLESYGERLDDLETQIIQSPESTTMSSIHDIKRELLELRRKIWPLRDALNTLVRDPVPEVADSTRIYLRDCYDHIMRIIDLLEAYRDLSSDLLEFQLSSISYKINEVMRVLTVIATIFIPLTFIAGVYGMNFDPDTSPWNMPELRWFWGYPFALGLMLFVTLGLLAFFYRKGWLGGGHRGLVAKDNRHRN
jgi:magnesium transporter